MGDLIKQTPYSEITATLEILDRCGLDREDLQRFRKASPWFQEQIIFALASGKDEFFYPTVRGTVDCDADPVVQEDWRIHSHRKGGQVILDPSKLKLYVPNLEADPQDAWEKYFQDLIAKPGILNANALDYLVEHPRCIPGDWPPWRKIFFLGTTYFKRGDRIAKYLFRYGGRWGQAAECIDGRFFGGGEAVAVLGS